MAQKSIKKRIKVTRGGKVIRRATSLGHNKGNKSTVQKMRKKNKRPLIIRAKTLSRYL